MGQRKDDSDALNFVSSIETKNISIFCDCYAN